MSTLKTTNITHGSNSGTVNLALASDGKTTLGSALNAIDIAHASKSGAANLRLTSAGSVILGRDTAGAQDLTDPGVLFDRQNSTFNGVGIIKNTTAWGTALYLHRTSTAGVGTFSEYAYNGSTCGSVSSNGTSNVSFNTSSDYRLKQDIVSITDGITQIKKLTPRRFKWKSSLDLGFQDGFIAHEVQESGAINGIVQGTKDGTRKKYDDPSTDEPDYQSMDYAKLTPLLTAALKEAIAKIETLETKVAALEAG